MNLKPLIFLTIIAIFAQISSVSAQEVGSIKIKSTSEAILGKEMAEQYAKVLDIDEEITWSIYVPENYDPANPPGVLLYQNYGSGLKDPTGWRSAVEEKNLILIRLVEGGTLIQRKEMLLSVLAPLVLQQNYNIKPSRVYTSAFAGCRNAGTLAKIYPNIIKGALYINCVPSTWRKKEPELIELMRQNRYLFIAGKDRVEQVNVTQELRKYRRAGIENTKFIRTGRLSRTKNLNRTMMLDAIDYLDGIDNYDSDGD